MKIQSDIVRGMALVSRADAGLGEPRVSLEQPRLGQDLSRLKEHRPGVTPLQYAMTKVAGLIAPPYQAIDDESPAGRPVDEHSLEDYVRAVLGMAHDATMIDPDLAPYLDELSKNEMADRAEPVTGSSFTLLCILYMADQVPGPAKYGQFGREAFMGWLNRQLAPDTTIPQDCIPGRYFEEVQVRRKPAAGFTNRCAVQYGRDGADSVDVQAMHRANLRGADLRGADLRGADLRGADLGDADLEGAKLRGANLEGADLRGANLQDAKLRDADLRRTNLDDADLEGADLRGADLYDANLQDACLQFTNLRDANLRGAILRGADLRHANLRGADLRHANLRGADLRDANLRGADLLGADLRHANLRDADLEGAILYGADLYGADLQGATLSVTPALAVGIVFYKYTNLTGTRLVMPTEEAAASCQQLVAERMATWEAAQFDTYLNHRNNDGLGVLKNIAGLADSCRDTKQALMHAVVEELNAARIMLPGGVDALIPSLGDVLFEDPAYLEGQDAFSAWLCAGLLGDGSKPLDTRLGDAALQALGGHATRRLAAGGAITSVAIYQVLYAMRERAASSPEAGEKWTTQSRTLHEQYCTALEKAFPTLMGENSVYENESAVLYGENAFPLISADGQSCVIMTDQYYRQLVLGDRSRAPGERNCAWADLRCVRAGSDRTFPASVNDEGEGGTRGTVAVLEQFPLLRAAGHRENAAGAQDRMLALAGLTGTLRDRFTAALQRRFTSERMTGAADQIALGEIFATKIQDRGREVHLAPEHFDALRAQWRDDSPEAFAFRLLCMAALYTNYSSSHVFGSETESPNALRTYAEALLRKVHELDPGLLDNQDPGPPDNRLEGWVNKLKGAANEFQCTSVLYSLQSRHLGAVLSQEAGNGPLHHVRDDMIPLAWR